MKDKKNDMDWGVYAFYYTASLRYPKISYTNQLGSVVVLETQVESCPEHYACTTIDEIFRHALWILNELLTDWTILYYETVINVVMSVCVSFPCQMKINDDGIMRCSENDKMTINEKKHLIAFL